MMPFDIAEYRRRIANTKQRMEEAGIEVLLCTDPANMNYLTGYDGWSFYVPQLAVVALDQEEPVWIGRGIDANGARATTFLKSSNIVPYPDSYVHAIDRHPMNFVAEELARRGWGRARIGLEMDSYYFSPMGYEALRTGLPNARLTNSNALVNWVRSVKSPGEIALMDQAARILERVMAVAIKMMAPGQRQCDVVAAIVEAQIRGTEEFGGDYTSIVPMLPTGIGTSAPHLTWSDERFVAGESTILELAACRRRYHCPMARTVSLGRPPQRVADAAEIVVEGLNEALAFAKPGVTCEDVEAAWRRTIARKGLVKESRLGYSTGLNYPPDWGEHTMSLRPGDHTELQPNMTFHMIAGIWNDDWGIEISECFQVTETGARPFASVPRQMFVNG
ncbi:MAG TPA: M24 family metallopeptidase [Arenibaculum sp.]|nr:M24 family metallopeptidase [Arenibaculum sp.]